MFALGLAVSEIQGRQKLEKRQMTPNWIEHFTVKVRYVHQNLTPEVQLWSASHYDQRFPRYCTFCNSPLTTVLNVPKKNKKNVRPRADSSSAVQ